MTLPVKIHNESWIDENTSVDSALMKYYIETIVKQYTPKRVFVIGSVAAGTANQFSDIDFVVEADGFIDVDAVVGAIDIIPYRHISEPMREELQQKGVLVYEKL